MATTKEYADFVCEQTEKFGTVKSRKMFGEYMVYLNDKPIFLVCDNSVFVKKLPEISGICKECGFPYKGAKEHYTVDIEDSEILNKLIPVLERSMPTKKQMK